MAKILIAEDDADLAELITFLLKTNGHVVETAFDGETALKYIYSEKPDLIVVDLMMPVVDGYSMIQTLLRHEELAKIPVIIVSSKPRISTAIASSKNVASCLIKPFKAEDLYAEIKSALEK